MASDCGWLVMMMMMVQGQEKQQRRNRMRVRKIPSILCRNFIAGRNEFSGSVQSQGTV